MCCVSLSAIVINFARIHTQTLITGSVGKQELNAVSEEESVGTEGPTATRPGDTGDSVIPRDALGYTHVLMHGDQEQHPCAAHPLCCISTHPLLGFSTAEAGLWLFLALPGLSSSISAQAEPSLGRMGEYQQCVALCHDEPLAGKLLLCCCRTRCLP